MDKGENEFYSREDAADVLNEVARSGSVGCYPSEINPENLGKAIARMLINYEGRYATSVGQLVRGLWFNRDERGIQRYQIEVPK